MVDVPTFWKYLLRKHIFGTQIWTVLTYLLKKESIWVTNCFWVADRIRGFCFPLKLDTSIIYNDAFAQDRLQINQSTQTLSQVQTWCLAKNFAQENRQMGSHLRNNYTRYCNAIKHSKMTPMLHQEVCCNWKIIK